MVSGFDSGPVPILAITPAYPQRRSSKAKLRGLPFFERACGPAATRVPVLLKDVAELARKALAILKTGDTKQIDERALATSRAEPGRFLVTKNLADIGAFKSKTLRNIGTTAP
jgi:hypothetical protein